MKEIKLTQGKVALVDDEDFDLLNQCKWHINKTKGDYTSYAAKTDYTTGNRKTILMHRVILGLTDPKIHCDHKDHNGLNNQRDNLRVVLHAENVCNKNPKRNGSSKYLGVCWDKQMGKWRAEIRKNRKGNFIGLFNSEIDAAIAYNNAAKRLHGEFANLNLI